MKTVVVDPDRSTVIARNFVAARVATRPVVVSTAAGAMLFFSGFSADRAYSFFTYAVPLTGEGAPLEEPQLIAVGPLHDAVTANGAPVIAVGSAAGTALLRIGPVRRIAQRIALLPPDLGALESMTWNGTNLLIATNSASTNLVLTSLDGAEMRRSPFADIDSYPHPKGIVSAGDTDLLLWQEYAEWRDLGPFVGRFRDGRQLDPGTPVALQTRLASDGRPRFWCCSKRAPIRSPRGCFRSKESHRGSAAARSRLTSRRDLG